MLRQWGKACFICDIQGSRPQHVAPSPQASSGCLKVPWTTLTKTKLIASVWHASGFDSTPPRRSVARSQRPSSGRRSAWGRRRTDFLHALCNPWHSSRAALHTPRNAPPQAVTRTSSADLFREPKCCICLDAKPTVPSMLCGHVALCEDCAGVVESGTKQCPMCRERFVRRM